MFNYKYKLFGRFKGRKKNYLMPFNEFDLNIHNKNINTNIKINDYNILDIGSGSGENAVYLSHLHAKAKIFTCELFEDGNINLHNKIIEHKINNIRMYKGNVLELLDYIEIKKIFNEIWILFPDPWPKVRHHKRRLINEFFLKKIHLYLKNGGKIMLASDSQSYIRSIMLTIFNTRGYYFWKNQKIDEWNYDILDLPKTKYYQKAKKSNRNPIFFHLIKI